MLGCIRYCTDSKREPANCFLYDTDPPLFLVRIDSALRVALHRKNESSQFVLSDFAVTMTGAGSVAARRDMSELER